MYETNWSWTDANSACEGGDSGRDRSGTSARQGGVGVDVSPVNLRDATEIERSVSAFARTPNGGLIVTGSALGATHRALIIALAARHKLPAVHSNRLSVAAGGLVFL
jgi:putative ABC transport system substrate-binding protein